MAVRIRIILIQNAVLKSDPIYAIEFKTVTRLVTVGMIHQNVGSRRSGMVVAGDQHSFIAVAVRIVASLDLYVAESRIATTLLAVKGIGGAPIPLKLDSVAALGELGSVAAIDYPVIAINDRGSIKYCLADMVRLIETRIAAVFSSRWRLDGDR